MGRGQQDPLCGLVLEITQCLTTTFCSLGGRCQVQPAVHGEGNGNPPSERDVKDSVSIY